MNASSLLVESTLLAPVYQTLALKLEYGTSLLGNASTLLELLIKLESATCLLMVNTFVLRTKTSLVQSLK